MPSVTIIKFEGSEDEISRFLTQSGHTTAIPQSAVGGPNQSNRMWDQVAAKFEQHIRTTAAGGRPGQKHAMLAWLRSEGKIELTKLWKAAGVKTQHDYAGVGGSLTKNMRKAGGPKEWYSGHLDSAGQWQYVIFSELVEPLKKAFGI